MRVCVYTAVYGSYDHLLVQPEQTVPCDFVCFTESRELKAADPWTIIHSDLYPTFHPRMRAKYFKILNNRLFPAGRLDNTDGLFVGEEHNDAQYDFTVWIDGNVQLKSPDFVEMMISHAHDNGWSMFIHPDRNCIYDELEASLTMPKYEGLKLRDQVESYRSEGYPEHNGLMACTVIARKTGDANLSSINEMWWEENVNWSYQDQLSLPVVLWRLGRNYDPINLSLWYNDYFDRIRHRSKL